MENANETNYSCKMFHNHMRAYIDGELTGKIKNIFSGTCIELCYMSKCPQRNGTCKKLACRAYRIKNFTGI